MNSVTPHLAVTDLERSIAFYRDFLGFETSFLQHARDESPFFAILRNGTVELMLCNWEYSASPPPFDGQAAGGGNLVIYLDVNDATSYWQRSRTLGTQVVKAMIDTDWGTREFWLRDPDGWIVAISQTLGTSDAG